LRTGKPLLANQKVYESLVESGEVEVFGAPTNDWLGVPLIIEDKTIGVLAIQLYDMNLNYREDDRQLMTFVSSVVASAIERKQVQQEIKYSYELQDVLNSLLTISLENIPLTVYFNPGIGYYYFRSLYDNHAKGRDIFGGK